MYSEALGIIGSAKAFAGFPALPPGMHHRPMATIYQGPRHQPISLKNRHTYDKIMDITMNFIILHSTTTRQKDLQDKLEKGAVTLPLRVVMQRMGVAVPWRL